MRICGKCGAKLTGVGLAGLCPRCVLREGLAPAEAGSPGPDAPPGALKLDLPDAQDEALGTHINHYKLLERVGEGGCGVVYVAEQIEPVRRRVALKIIKLGMDTKQVVARFEAERQALAMMDHPNIAKVLDGGSTDTGRPFFVMELVRGIRITDYCDRNHLSTPTRLDLFIQVCHAIQHAHQKGIIHRDIKPSNILVTLHDGVPVPKVIDFGIAKATEGRLTEATIYTQLHQFIGTPVYMSPEQAEMSGLDIDTRSDIYSLGVLLYELLAGSTPFDAKELMSQGIDAIRKTIREKEPPRPSTRLATLKGEELTTTAKRRAVEAPKLISLLRGDLDWIVMKCLEKDRTRRYETANGLADDLTRHLTHEPVVARPHSTLYRLRKSVRRNRLAYTAATAVVMALALGVAFSSWQAVRAIRAEKLAGQRLVESEKARGEAEAIANFLTGVFASPDPARDGRTITVAETLDTAVKKLETELTGQPARRAQLQATLSITYSALGLYREAISLHEKVRDYRLANSGPEHPDTLAAMANLTGFYFAAGRRGEALKLSEEVVRLYHKVLGPEDPGTLPAMNNLARSYEAAGRPDEALKLYEQVLPLCRKVLGPEHPDTLTAMNNLGTSYLAAGRQDEGLKTFEEMLTASRKVKGPEHPHTLIAMNNLAVSYFAAGRRDEAIKLQEEVLNLSGKVNGREHPDTLNVMGSLAGSYRDVGRRDEGLKLLEEVLKLSRKVLGPEHPATLRAMNDVAVSYFEVGRRDEAIKLGEEVLPFDRKVLGPESPETLTVMNNLAKSYFAAGRRDEALKLREEVLTLSRKVNGSEHPATLRAMHGLADSYAAASRMDEAFKLREEVLPLSRKVLGPEHPHTLKAMGNLADSYIAADRGDEALNLVLEGLALSLRKDPNSPASAAAYAQLGFRLDALGRGDDAIKAWQEAVRIDPGKADVQFSLNVHYWLGKALVDRERYAEALPILRATQKLFPDGERGQEVALRLALAESKAETEKPPTRAPSGESVTAWLTGLRQWVAASPTDKVTALRQAVAANPTDTDKAKHLAIVYLWLGETNEHRAICRKLLEFATNSKNSTAHDHAAKAYLLQAHPDPETLKQAVAAGRQALRLTAPSDPNQGWFLITAALAAIRDGAPAEAEPLLTEALSVPGGHRDLRGLALACRAMARAQLGRTNEAQADFAELEKIKPACPPAPTVSPIVLQPDAMAVALAYKEARALLTPPQTSPQ